MLYSKCCYQPVLYSTKAAQTLKQSVGYWCITVKTRQEGAESTVSAVTTSAEAVVAVTTSAAVVAGDWPAFASRGTLPGWEGIESVKTPPATRASSASSNYGLQGVA